MVNKKLVILISIIILSLIIIPIVHASFLDDLLIWLNLKEKQETTNPLDNIHYFDRGNKLPDNFTKLVNLTYENNNFKIKGLNEDITLIPYMIYNNKKFVLQNDTIATRLSLINKNIGNDFYKFGLNLTVNKLINKLNINEVGFDIITNSNIKLNPDDKNSFYTNSMRFNFDDLVEQGYIVEITNSTGNLMKVKITNLSNKDLFLDPTLEYIADVNKGMAMAPAGTNKVGIIWSTPTATWVQVFYTNGTNATVPKIVTATIPDGTTLHQLDIAFANLTDATICVKFKCYKYHPDFVGTTNLVVEILTYTTTATYGAVCVKYYDDTSFLLAWYNENATSTDAKYGNYYFNGGTIVSGIIQLNLDMPLDQIGCDTFNSSDGVVGYQNRKVGDWMTATINKEAGARAPITVLDASDARGGVAVRTVDQFNYGVEFYTNSDTNTKLYTLNFSGTAIANKNLDKSGGQNYRMSIAKINSTGLAPAWRTDLKFNIHDINTANTTGYLTVGGGDKAFDIVSQSSNGVSLCNGNIVIANTTAFATYNKTLGVWDGLCADVTPPTITPSQPLDADTLTAVPIRFEVNTTDETSLKNVSLIANWTGTFIINETRDLTGQLTNTSNWDINLNNGNYTYNFIVCDTSNNCILNTNRTLKVLVNYAPVITESSFYKTPAGTTTNLNETIRCVDRNDVNLELNFTWYKNNIVLSTINVSATNNSILNISLSYGLFTDDDLINITSICYDGVTNSSITMHSVTIIEVTPPVVSIISPADNYNLTNRSISINCSATDNINISTFKLYGNWSGSFDVNATRLLGGTSNSTIFTVTNLPYGLYKYTCWANDTSNNYAFVNENRTFTSEDADNPNLTLIKPHAIYLNDEIIEVKYIANDINGLSTCRYSYDNWITNTTLTCDNNDTITIPVKDYEMKLYVNDTFGHYNTTSRNFTMFNISVVTYTNNNTETNFTNFLINISKGTGSISNITFTYYNTIYNTGFVNTTSTSNGQTNLTWSKSLTLPFVTPSTLNQTNYNLVFNITLEYNGYINITNSSVLPQTVNRIILYSPCIQNNQAINYTLIDEETNTVINSTLNNVSIEESYYVYLTDSNLSRHYNFVHNSSYFYRTGNWSLCISPAWLKATVNTVVQYGATDYNTKIFAINNWSISNLTNITTLYLLNSLTGTNVNIFTIDTINNPLSGYTIETRRYLIGADQYILTESKITNFNGMIQEILKLGTVYYKFTIKNTAGAIVYDSGNMFVTDTSLYFKISLTPSPFIPIIPLESLTRSLTWSNASRNVTLTWDDDDDLLSNICLQTFRYEMANISKINEQCSTSSSGTLRYNINPSLTGYYQARAIGTANEDSLDYPLETLDIDLRTGKDVYGLDGVFASLLIIGTMAGIGAFTGSLVATLALTGLGLFIVSVMGYLSVSASAIIGLIIVMIILSVKLKY